MSDSPLRPVQMQVFYRKNIQLAPYNNAEVGLIITLEALPEAVIDPAAVGEALQPCWEAMQSFVHAQEDTAHTRYLAGLPEEQRPWRPRRGGRASFQAALVEVTGPEPDEPPPFPDAPHPAEAEANAEPDATVPPFPAAAPEQPGEDGEAPAVPDAVPDAAPAESAAPAGPPQTSGEARRRYFARYGEALGGDTFFHVRRFFGEAALDEPLSVEAWVALAERTRDELRARDAQLAKGRAALAAGEAKAETMKPARRAARPIR